MKRGLLTFDVETWFSVTDFAGCIDRQSFSRMPLRLEKPINLLLDMLDEQGVTGVSATFFFMGAVAEREPRLVRLVTERGHEVGCHSMRHRLLYDLDDAELKTEIMDARRLLEDIAGCRVQGFRAPTFSLTKRVIEHMVKAGYRYDSSLWVGRDDLLDELNEAGIKEFAISTRRFMKRLVPMGGGYMRLLGPDFYNKVLRQGPEPLVLYLHPWEFDPYHPRMPQASLWSRFKHYNGLGRTKAILSSLLRRAKWGTCRSAL